VSIQIQRDRCSGEGDRRDSGNVTAGNGHDSRQAVAPLTGLNEGGIALELRMELRMGGMIAIQRNDVSS
jgi:hypothetical protein